MNEESPRCGGTGMVAYWDGSAYAGEMCRGCKDCEPNVEALIVQASAWQAQFFDDEVRKWAFTAREIEARQIIADLMLCVLEPPASAPQPTTTTNDDDHTRVDNGIGSRATGSTASDNEVI